MPHLQQHQGHLRAAAAAAAWDEGTGIKSGSGGVKSMGAAAVTVSSNAFDGLSVDACLELLKCPVTCTKAYMHML
jgi:hypothetical protein